MEFLLPSAEFFLPFREFLLELINIITSRFGQEQLCGQISAIHQLEITGTHLFRHSMIKLSLMDFGL